MGDEWRFQWPDGTWIRWNPQKQSWEKEDRLEPDGMDAGGASEPPVDADASVSPEPELFLESDDAGRGAVVAVPVESPGEARSGTTDLGELAVDPATVVERRSERSADTRTISRRRPTALDVLPPQPEPDRPGGSLWPTIVAGAVVGVGVGLLLVAMIR